MHKFWFAGHCCREYGIYVSGENTFNGPERGYELVSIPGRSGEITSGIKTSRFLIPLLSTKTFCGTRTRRACGSSALR